MTKKVRHIERRGIDRTVKRRVYVEARVGSRLAGLPQKGWIDFLKKRGLKVGQVRRMVYDRNEWREFVREIARGMNP